MSEICSKCGLPKELCACETIAKESQQIIVKLEKKKFNKVYTVVEGTDPDEIDVKEMTKRLKSELACGGTYKDGKVELQGNHRARVREILLKMGFPQETIKVQ